MLLPGEVFTTTSWYSKEVSRSHSTISNELYTENTDGLTIWEGQNFRLL